MNPNRKEYWNRSYLEYWKSRVDETIQPGRESTIIQGDAKTEDDAVYDEVFRMHPPRPGSVLDVGCAWGRMFPLFRRVGLKISGIDISKAMIDQATIDWGTDPAVESLHECEAEKICHDDGKFDNVACLAVFDATYQHLALSEFLRVLRIDGLLFLTGKHDSYPDDDVLAMQAEVGARGKNHPNYFTDTPAMISQLRAQGHEIVATYFFQRRGDFGALQFVRDMPQSFYEYFLVIRKAAPAGAFEPFSSDFSRTFRRTA